MSRGVVRGAKVHAMYSSEDLQLSEESLRDRQINMYSSEMRFSSLALSDSP